jgi:hypothetical protein
MLSSQGTDGEVVSFLQSSLEGHGLQNVTVMKQTTTKFNQEFYIRKELYDDEDILYKFSFSHSDVESTPRMEKLLTLEAERAAKDILDKLTTTFTVGEIDVQVSTQDGGWAMCNKCGNKVDANIEHITRNVSRELSAPYVAKRDMEKQLSEMDEQQKLVFKMYLLGKIKQDCDHDVQMTERFKYDNLQ